MTDPKLWVYSDAHYLIEQCGDCAVPGYLIVTPLSGANSLEDLTSEERAALGDVLALAVAAVNEAARPVRVYCAQFGETGGRLHFHIFPRTEEITREYLQENSLEQAVIDGPILLAWSRKKYARWESRGRLEAAIRRIREAFKKQARHAARNEESMAHSVSLSELSDHEVDMMRSLVDEFVLSHRSFRFREDYWSACREWLLKLNGLESSRVIVAKSEGKIVGFAVGQILDNGPLLSPEKIGYGSIMVVEKHFRKEGMGSALWRTMKDWFLEKGVVQVEIYTERGNTIAESFWEKQGFPVFLHRRRCFIGEE